MRSDNPPARRFPLLLLCLAVLLPCAAAPTLAAPQREVLTVGVPADRCPIFYTDADTGEPTGIGVDLMRTAAEEAGYAAVFCVIREETLKDALDSAAYDVIMPFGSAIPSAAGRPTVVSDNLMQTPFTLVTEGRRELPPLNALRVGMLRSLSGAAETVRELFPGIEITMYETVPACVKALRGGEVDALLHNSYVWSYVLQKPSYADLSIQPSNMFSMDFRAGTLDTPAGRAVIERLNGGIGALSGTRVQAVILDHTSRRLYRYDFFDYLHLYGLILLLSALLFAALTIITLQKRRALRLEQEERLRELVERDPLTGVLSLKGFRKRVEALLRSHPDTPYLLSYTNIRNFKYINDSLGMAAGDELLRFWADKSKAVLSEAEAIGRVEGDRFAVLRRINSDEQMLLDERDVREPLRNYLVERRQGNRLQVSSGVYVLSPSDYQQIHVDHMLDCARLAEKRVAETTRDGYEFYNPDQWERGKRLASITGHLTEAIRDGELQVWYQPQVNFDTGEITGAEALCRWNHAKLGWLSPAEFIPALEETGLVYELDRFVWEQACRDLRRWREAGVRRSVSVNLARCDIREERNIPGQFYDLIRTYGLDADQLHIEITESAYVENPDLLIRTTVKLREFGFQVEMDDFGSGYSSLHMLKEVPVDRIKLDLHFLTGSGEAERGRVIISYMIQMVRSLGMELIAEGVENLAQARMLQDRGCPDMQGFYFYKPMTVRDFERLFLPASSGRQAGEAKQPPRA